jgi:FkbM family methyltransferase
MSCHKRFGIAGISNAIKRKLGMSNGLIKAERKDIRHPFYLRKRTCDIPIFDQVFIKNEYDFETIDTPKVIVDAGANIGLASIYFANKYPASKIIAIEPEESNFKMLQLNAAPYENIIILQAALWDRNEEISVVDTGRGKCAYMTQKKNDHMEQGDNVCQHVQGKTVNRIMQDYDLDRINVLKIDIEGAEREVFGDTSSWIGRIDAIIIELHERFKPGCNRTFYNGSQGFDDEWLQGENIYLSRSNCIKRRLRHI